MQYIKWIIGIGVGALLGFTYWYYIGCTFGTCAITSSPTNSTIYGALMGGLLANTFSGKRSKREG